MLHPWMLFYQTSQHLPLHKQLLLYVINKGGSPKKIKK